MTPHRSLAGIIVIAARCFTVLGVRELLGGFGLGIAAILLVVLGNRFSGLVSAPETLPSYWGSIGQVLSPGATGALMRDGTFLDGLSATRPVTLMCCLVVGVALYVLGLIRARRNDTVDGVNRIEFDRQRHGEITLDGGRVAAVPAAPSMGGRQRQLVDIDRQHDWALSAPPPTPPPTPLRGASRRYFNPQHVYDPREPRQLATNDVTTRLR